MSRALAIVTALAGVAHADGAAIGAEVGEPTSATVGWFAHALSVDAALGSGTLYGPGLSVHVDVQTIATRLGDKLPLRIGLGARYYNQHYKPASMDEVPSTNYGLRLPIALAYELGSAQLYVEAAPGIDFKRTPSCTLLDGPDSICPHAQAKPVFFDAVIGLRWYLSH